MKRVIVDYSKLTEDILNLLVEKFPDGYDETDIIRFRNAQNEIIEAVEVRTDDTIFLVKVSKKLATRMEKFEEEEDDIEVEIDVIAPDKSLGIEDDEIDDDDDESDLLNDKDTSDEDEDEDNFESSEPYDDEDDEDED